MKTREHGSAPRVAAHSSALRRWWLDRSVRTKGMIVVAVPLVALMATVAASLTLQASIGLALARAFARAMSGQLTVASTVGEGSTFTLTLPRAADMRPGRPKPAPLPAQRAAAATTQTGVLYIEDNPANIEVVTRYVRTRPRIELRTASSGLEGLDLAARQVPDLILLDLHLPGMSGSEVLRELRANPATADVPVAVLSADASPSVIREMRVRGVVAYLTKPLDLAELGQLLDGFTEWRRPAGPGDLASGVTTGTGEPR